MDAKAANDERCCRGRRSRVVLTPRRWCQVRGKQNFSRATVARKPDHRGERGVSRKPLRREGRDASAEPVCSCAFFCACLHTRPRVQRAPGFPCALLFLSRAAIDAKLGRIAPRECGRTSPRCMTIELEIHTHVVPSKRLVRRTTARFWRQPWPECGVTGRITPTGVVGGFVKPKLPNPL